MINLFSILPRRAGGEAKAPGGAKGMGVMGLSRLDVSRITKIPPSELMPIYKTHKVTIYVRFSPYDPDYITDIVVVYHGSQEEHGTIIHVSPQGTLKYDVTPFNINVSRW